MIALKAASAPCGSKLVSHVKLDLYLPGNKRLEATGFLGMLTVFPGAAALLGLPPEGEVCTHTRSPHFLRTSFRFPRQQPEVLVNPYNPALNKVTQKPDKVRHPKAE